MELLRILRERLAGLTPQRRATEIAIAVLLTVAAAVFIAAALTGGPPDAKAPYATARTPPPN